MSRISQKFTNEFILLGFISEQPMHGYDLYKLLNTDGNISQIWSVKQAMLYAILDKLEESGFLTSQTVSSGNYPNRKQFHITSVGQDALQEWLETPVSRPWEIRQEFLGKFYFAYRKDRKAARILLDKQKSVCEQWLEIHQQHISETDEDPFTRYILDFKQAQMQFIYDWIQYTLESMPV
jgi:DNA-binding PadR family transcriptional regulator